ncbi:MAG: cytochrome c-type biogenesis CcmF C-terminal domain-containing protein, partial [Candidatus Acidiferrales bacterium]
FGARNFYALVAIFLAFFVIGTIALEFFRGARVIHQKEERNWAGAVIELTRRNTRRYGGYVIHFGVALLFIGFVGSAFTIHEQAEVLPGDEVAVRNYRFVVQSLDQQETDNHIASQARIDVFRNDKFLATLTPERRFYKASGQPTTEVAIWPHLSKPLEIFQHPNADIYLVFAGMAEDNQRAVLQIYINPLVLWVWVGGAVMVFGTGIALVPSRPPQPGRPTRKRKPAKERDEVAA